MQMTGRDIIKQLDNANLACFIDDKCSLCVFRDKDECPDAICAVGIRAWLDNNHDVSIENKWQSILKTSI